MTKSVMVNKKQCDNEKTPAIGTLLCWGYTEKNHNFNTLLKLYVWKCFNHIFEFVAMVY